MPRLLALALPLLLAAAAAAQPLSFGSAENPAEAVAAGRSRLLLDVMGGPSYIGVTWRGAVGLEAEAEAGPFALALGGRLRGGLHSVYGPDLDEAYDLVRLVRYVRLNPTPSLPVYARLGPLQHVQFGPGHLVRAFASTADWDRRTVGLEAAAAFPFGSLEAFAEDVRLGRLAGARLALAPLAGLGAPRLRTLRLGASALHDFRFGWEAPERTTALALEARLEVLRLDDFALSPWLSYARFLEYGSGLGLGADFAAEDLAGLGRLGLSAGLFLSGERFVPGYFGAFYAVDNPAARIWDADAYYADRSHDRPRGTPLAEAQGGTSVFLHLHALVFEALELGAYARRDYSGDALSEGALRLTLSPSRGRSVRFVFEIQRQGLTSVPSLFSNFLDENLLVFHLDYALAEPLRLYLRSRYGFARVADAPDGSARYLTQRRFEPLLGARLRF